MAQPEPGQRGVFLRYGYATNRGLKRELNEDSLIASEPIFAVADGMGGHEAGEIASGICVRTLGASPVIGEHAPTFAAADLQELIRSADGRIREETGGMAGTTLSGVVVVSESGAPYWLFFNVGDSRTYRLSLGTFAQVTVDHSEVQELVDLGRITPAQAQVHPRRHVVTRALGTGTETDADFWLLPVEEGDRVMVCSDGLTGEVSDEYIGHILANIIDPQAATDSLIEATLRSGARDNVSVIVIDASGVSAESLQDTGQAGPDLKVGTDMRAGPDLKAGPDTGDQSLRPPSKPHIFSADQPGPPPEPQPAEGAT